MLPLYRESQERANKDKASGHKGLWYDKFCNQWHDTDPSKGLRPLDPGSKKDGKRFWLDSVCKDPAGDKPAIEEALRRQERMVKALGGVLLKFVSESRFVTGLGREHPLENGFVWHHCLGTPYLPGSSVKGMTRSWAKSWAGAELTDTDVARIFGPSDDEAREDPRAGSVIFLDALPTGPVTLKADVMTPHYGPYYMKGEVPGDWYSPVPVLYLTMAPGQKFHFAILPRTANGAGDLELAKTWLMDALAFIGAGAKTGQGYGRFIPIDSNTTCQEHIGTTTQSTDAQLLLSTPLECFKHWFVTQRFKPADRGRHNQITDYIEKKLNGSLEAKAFVRSNIARDNCSKYFWGYLNS